MILNDTILCTPLDSWKLNLHYKLDPPHFKANEKDLDPMSEYLNNLQKHNELKIKCPIKAK